MEAEQIEPVASATSQDVARLAGVSKTAVSLVLNGRGSRHGLSAATQDRVRIAAEALGYTPNHAARSLRRQRTNIITFLASDLGNRYSAEVMNAAEAVARSRGYVVNVIPAASDDAEQEALDRLGAGVSDGLVVHGGSGRTRERILALRRRGLACVLLQDAGDGLPCVRVDIAAGGMMATRHLLALGHRRIAHVTSRRLLGQPVNDRLQGYRDALHEAGIEMDPALVAGGDNSLAGGDAAIRTLLARPGPPPTAVFMFNDQMAIGGLHALAALGLHVPGDMAVVGFDGTELGAYSVPELTTIDHPRAELGRLAATSVLDQIEGARVPAMTVLPVSLVIRASCGATNHATANHGPIKGRDREGQQ